MADINGIASANDTIDEGPSGSYIQYTHVTELLTIAADVTTLSAIQLPANSIITAVVARVTVALPGAATFSILAHTSGTTLLTSMDATANATGLAVENCPYSNGAAQVLRITPNAAPSSNAGRVRLVIYYYSAVAPTS